MLTTTSRLSLVLALAAALTLTGLSRPRVAEAQAETITINRTVPILFFPFVPCANGEVTSFHSTFNTDCK